MKKLTLEIDLMDIFSDVENGGYEPDVESVGETLKRELKDRVLNEISNKIIKNYSERLEEEIKPFYLETLEKLKKDIASFYETYMDKKVIITDSYGYITKENISIRELIQEKIEDSISLKPKSQLRESINNTCKYEIDKAVNKVVYELQKEMNEQITLEMAKKIKEKLLS